MKKDDKITLGTQPGMFWGRRPYTVDAGQAVGHGHILGITGSGKSRFIAHLYSELQRVGYGVTLIDPAGDLAELVASRTGNPHLALQAAHENGEYLPFNVLKSPHPPHETALHVVEAFQRAFPELATGAPAFETMVTNGVKLLISNDHPLTHLAPLITRSDFRKSLYAREDDRDVASFFTEYFDKLPIRDREAVAGSAMRRINLLGFSQILKHSLSAPELGIDARSLMEKGRGTVFNLGGIERKTQRLLGSLLTTFIEQAAIGRRAGPPHFLIIDEFSLFSAQSEDALASVLSTCRKWGLFLILAHQDWDQASRKMRGALNNVSLDVVFRLGRPDAELSAPSLMRFDPERIKHDTQNPNAHPLYDPLLEQRELFIQRLTDLNDRHALVRLRNSSVLELRSVDVPDVPQTAHTEPYTRSYFTPAIKHEEKMATPIKRAEKLY